MKKLFDRLLAFYQGFLSPGRQGFLKSLYPFQCRYTPSCSDYARQAIKKHGALKGGLKSLWRILRCNPWSKGGIDLA